MPSAAAAKSIKQFATSLGFDACGIAPAGPIDPDNRLGQWLDADYQATMTWMARTRAVRQDANEKLPGAKSVIVVARNYYAQRPAQGPNTGKVSRYAWGRDYHRVLEKPLRRLAAFVSECVPGAATYCCIDSGPVMEKAWAARAGVGWIGKNSLVLRRGLGSFFFLGAIVATADLAPDAPVAEQCGGCTLCIDACPTQAIVQAKVVDARRCISYHTIENRGEVPSELSTHFGDWVFGCDVCQDVCPWNRALRETTERDFLPRAGNADIDLDELRDFTDEGFARRFAGTPIMRAKVHGMKRNAEIAKKNATA